jgi:hypothetical protein
VLTAIEEWADVESGGLEMTMPGGANFCGLVV